jgi:hypothetical protein
MYLTKNFMWSIGKTEKLAAALVPGFVSSILVNLSQELVPLTVFYVL